MNQIAGNDEITLNELSVNYLQIKSFKVRCLQLYLLINRYWQLVQVLQSMYYDQNNCWNILKLLSLTAILHCEIASEILRLFIESGIDKCIIETVRKIFAHSWTLFTVYITVYIMEFTRFEPTRINIELHMNRCLATVIQWIIQESTIMSHFVKDFHILNHGFKSSNHI